MKLQAVKGTRDFYPDEMARRNWLIDAWRRVSLRNGFVEFDGPAIEYLDLYRAKSGDEIVSQLFNFQDRGGRELALRPEITPTLARMVNARVNSLPRPIKWFAVPRLWRAENPQRGRLREFFQWNIDIIGPDEPVADAECVFTAVDLFQEIGLTSSDVVVRYSSRRLLAEVLRNFGLDEQSIPAVLAALDKRAKIPPDAFDEMYARVIPDTSARSGILRFLNMQEIGASPAESVAMNVGMKATQEIIYSLDNVRQFESALKAFGIAEWCKYDTGIVRGLAYYTGIVYEIFDTSAELRAVAGGGRYDNLLEVLGGPKIGATGFGMGDPVLSILLAEKGKLPALAGRLECFVVPGAEGAQAQVLSVVARLRRAGVVSDFSTNANVGKALNQANRRGADFAVIVRDENVGVKNLKTGQQTDVPVGEFLDNPGRLLSSP